jgi:hypothetical protein
MEIENKTPTFLDLKRELTGKLTSGLKISDLNEFMRGLNS